MTRTTFAPSLTYSIQDYVKCIYALTADGQPATTTAIAVRLGIAPASVTGMLQKMASARPPLVIYKKHQGVRLTENGRRAALEVIRHHRLIETWLVETLGYTWDEVHSEAERLEHAMSEDLERRIAASLGDPVRDPHGEPIPSPDLIMPSDNTVPIHDLRRGARAVVRRVHPPDDEVLRRLQILGISIGSRIRILDISPVDQIITVQVDGKAGRVSVGPVLAGHLHVEQLKVVPERKASQHG